LRKEIQDELAQEDNPIRRLSTWPIDRCFVYLDVSDFSRYLPGQQMLIINSIVQVVGSHEYWNLGSAIAAHEGVESMICIGDGYIFVLSDPVLAAYFAAYLANLIERFVAQKRLPVEFHFRMGVHRGPVYSFWDPGRNDWNYIGDGINGGQRVLSAIGKDTDDVLFMSGQMRQALTAQNDGSSPCHQILAALHNRCRKADKHGSLWRVYEVNHTELVGSIPF
jgi:class 3 adenylate cyclase